MSSLAIGCLLRPNGSRWNGIDDCPLITTIDQWLQWKGFTVYNWGRRRLEELQSPTGDKVPCVCTAVCDCWARTGINNTHTSKHIHKDAFSDTPLQNTDTLAMKCSAVEWKGFLRLQLILGLLCCEFTPVYSGQVSIYSTMSEQYRNIWKIFFWQIQ